MNGKPLKAFVFVFFMFWAVLTGATKSFAQDDSASDEQAREDQTQQTLNQIHDLALKMQENDQRLKALEKAVNQTITETAVTDTADTNSTAQEAPELAPAQEVPSQEAAAPTQAVVPVQAAAPVQIVSAKTSPEEQSVLYPSIAPISKENTFELSLEDFYSTYKEPGNFNKNGEFIGLYGAYTLRPMDIENWPINVFHVDAHGDYGVEDYNYEGDKIRNVSDYIVEPRIWFGRDFNFGEYNTLTPYAGFGYRWFYDRLKKKIDAEDDGGFNIQTQYFYVPVGAQLSVRPADGWHITLDSEYDFLAWGRVTDYLSNNGFGDTGLSNVTNSVRQGYGIQDSIKIVKEGVSVNYFFEPYVRYWNIKASNTVSVAGFPIQESRNHTTEVGARVGVDF